MKKMIGKLIDVLVGGETCFVFLCLDLFEPPNKVRKKTTLSIPGTYKTKFAFQRVCQRKRKGRKPSGFPQTSKTAANRAGAKRISQMDIQSR